MAAISMTARTCNGSRQFLRACLFGFALLLAGSAARAASTGAFTNFETPSVHPIALSPNGAMLAVANLANGTLELYDLTPGIPIGVAVIPVGVDPTSVRFLNDGEAWVVNNISDSISVVDIANRRVRATISTVYTDASDSQIKRAVPYDLVFVPGSPARAFVSCAEQGSVQVFNASTLARTDTIAINFETPRAMAVSPDGGRVYVASFESGNRTTILGGGADDGDTLAFPLNVVSDPAGPYGGQNPPPNNGATFKPPFNPSLPPAPKVGLIVRQNAAGAWMDDNNRDWTSLVSGANAAKSSRPVGWSMPDRDLAIIDTSSLSASYATGIMQACMGVAVNPADGRVYVIGTDATNEIRFEPNVNGKFNRVEVGVVDPAGPTTLSIVDLNPHLDYSVSQLAQSERDKSLGDPRGIVWNAAGTRGYVTGMGSNNMIVIDAAGSRILGTDAAPAELGPGPTGLALDEARNRLYVVNKFDGTLSILDATTLAEIKRATYFDTTPAVIKTGRKHLYDTHKSSGLGQIACASCHIDGKMDRLAWDLGDPSGDLDPTAGQNDLVGDLIGGGVLDDNFHPMKGPMTTQTLQDIIGKEPLHWRGDRDGLENFNPAFVGLQGDNQMLTQAEMQQFEDLLATVVFPPNPFRKFDNTLPTALDTKQLASGRHALADGANLPLGNAQNGLLKYRGRFPGGNAGGSPALDSGIFDCVTCHTLPTGAGPDRVATLNGLALSFARFSGSPGPSGENHLGLVSVDGSTQDAIKIPQLRNQFDKMGFVMAPGHLESNAGFGLVHDGAVDSVARFVDEPIFNTASDQDTADLTAFILAFSGSDLPAGATAGTIFPRYAEPLGEPSNDSHASVGRQVTLAASGPNAIVSAMIAEASKPGPSPRGLDLVARAKSGGSEQLERGYLYNRASGNFIPDRNGNGEVSPTDLRALAAPGAEQTYTLVERGAGLRIGIDWDEDGVYNRTELEAGSDPTDGAITPGVQPNGDVSPPSLAFGPLDINGGPSASQTATIANSGNADLKFFGVMIMIGGRDAADFAIVNNPSTSPVSATQSRGVDIVFDPQTAGTKIAALYFVTNDYDINAPQVAIVQLSGVATIVPPINGAAPLAHTLPATMPQGSILFVGVTVTNTGNTTWDAANLYSLAVVSDPCGLASQAGGRLSIDAGVSVAPGSFYQFVVPVSAPMANGPCAIQFRMVQEFVEFFGATIDATVNIVSPPNAAIDWERYD